jgi:hypothetical protein
MSKHNRPRLSLKGDPNALTTAPIAEAQVDVKKPTQERPMQTELNQAEAPAAQTGPTAKQMAEAEERAGSVAKAQTEAKQEEPLKLINVASKGRDALSEAFAAHNAKAKARPAYKPPPMTERQLAVRAEEMEAGRKVQQKAEASIAAGRVRKPDPVKEGFTTPVYRPGEFVPGMNSKDPAIAK